jgi:hypothetical protein
MENRKEQLKAYKSTEKYKEYNREYQKQYRLKKKQNKVNNDDEIYKNRLNKSLSDKTKNQYINIISRITQKNNNFKSKDLEDKLNYVFTGKELNKSHYTYFKKNLKYTDDNFYHYMQEQYHNKITLKVYLIPYVVLFSYLALNKYFKKKYLFLNEIIVNLNNDYELKRDDNVVTDEDKQKIITDYNENTIINNMDLLDTELEKVIYGLYTLLAPRRLEYINVFLTTKSSKIDDDKNYLILTKRFPSHFIFNKYKTSNAYGSQHINIPTSLGKIIYNYIKFYKLKSGDKFIQVTYNKFIKLTKSVFKKIYDIDNITNRWLRISYATHISSLNISNNEKNNLAVQMGHNSVQSSKYRKLL